MPNPVESKCHLGQRKPCILSLQAAGELQCLQAVGSGWGGCFAAAAGLQLWQAHVEALGHKAPLGKGEALNYFYSLKMTYLIHSVSYLPSGVSAWTYESYKQVYFFIFADRRRVAGYTTWREGGDGEGQADEHFKASLRGVCWYQGLFLLDMAVSHMRVWKPGVLCLWNKTPQALKTLDEAGRKGTYQKRRFPLLQFDHSTILGRWKGRAETVYRQWNHLCAFIQITPKLDKGFTDHHVKPASLVIICWHIWLYQIAIYGEKVTACVQIHPCSVLVSS